MIIKNTCVVFLLLYFLILPASATVTNITSSGDTYICCYYSNQGTDTVIDVGHEAAGQVTYGLVNFSNLSSIPVGSVINSATVYLYEHTGGNTGYVQSIYNVTSLWDEVTVTWSTIPSFNPTPFTSANGLASAGWMNWDTTSTVKGWIGGRYSSLSNYGFLINETVQETTSAWLEYYSRDYSDANYRPYLSVTWTANSVPVMQTNTIAPTTGYSTSTLTSTPSATDAEGDSITYTYLWYKDSVSTGVTTSTLSPPLTIGSSYKVFVTPSDAYGSGTGTYSNSVTIQSIPVGTIYANIDTNKDTYVASYDQNTNFGTSSNLLSEGDGGTYVYIGFDLSSIPANSVINSANLYMYANGTPAEHSITLGNITSSWTETGVTWNTKPTNETGSIFTFLGAAWRNWDISNSVKAWYDGSLTNNGIMRTEVGAWGLSSPSREAAIHTPYINVSYVPPSYLPPAPTNCQAATGKWWINTSCQAGSGNKTDAMNKSVNGTFFNTTDFYFNSTGIQPDGYQSILFYAYNSTGLGTLNYEYASLNTSIPMPAVVTNLSAGTGNFYVNTTWGMGVNTDLYNVSQDGTWTNLTAINFTNASVGAHGRNNVSVCGYNTILEYCGSYTTLNTQIPDNAPAISGSGSISSSSFTTSDTATITITNITDADSDIITTVKAGVTLVGGNEVNYTMTTTDDSTWTYSYSTLTTGTYNITNFYASNSYGSTKKAAAIQFTVTSPANSGSGGGGSSGSGSTATIIVQEKEEDNATAVIPLLRLKNITSGATEPELEQIARCLTEGLVMENECSRLNNGLLIDPFNIWVYTGAFFSAWIVVVVRGVYQDKAREWFTEPLLYGTITVLFIAVLTASGFNFFILNYLTGSPKYAWTFISTALWGTIVAFAYDEYYYKGRKTYKIR